MQHININLIDTHFHLDLMPQPDAIAGKMQQRGISAIAVTNTPSVFHYTHLLSQKYSAILPAVGLHPELAAERKQELPIMWDWLAKTRFVGEIGLDYVTNDDENRKSQRSVFQAILTACAKYGDKVLTIHSRRSSKDVVSMIGDNFPGRIILHWYSGSIRDLTSGLSYGFFFSVNTAMVKSEKSRDLIQRIPKERILTETDGPFVEVGSRSATPLDVPEVIQSLADMWDQSVEATTKQVARNFQTLLSNTRK